MNFFEEGILLDIREYSYMLALVKSGSIIRAANELYITQPSLSVYIKRLENRIGLKLFQRIDGKISLTTAGEKYIEYAEKIVEIDARLMQELDIIKGNANEEVVLGISSIRSEVIFPRLLPMLKTKYPNIRLKSIEGNSKELEKMLKNNEIDLAIISQHKELENLESFNLITKKICIAVPADHPVCEKAIFQEGSNDPWMQMEHLKDCPVILLNKGMVLRNIADALFDEAGFEPIVYNETANSKTAFSLALAGVGVAFLWDTYFRYYKVEENKSVKFFYVEYPIEFSSIVVAYPSKKKLSVAAKALLDLIKEMDFERIYEGR